MRRSPFRYRWFWAATVLLTTLFFMADYHYSYSNQIPADGALTVGFPFPFQWTECGRGQDGCVSGTSAVCFVVDLALCMAGAVLALLWGVSFSRKQHARRKNFWGLVIAFVVFEFMVLSLVSAMYSGMRGSGQVDIGFPLGFLYAFHGTRIDLVNLGADLLMYVVPALYLAELTLKLILT